MTHSHKNIKGETLAETIIALSILAIGVAVASTVILNSLRNMTNAKNRLIAVNIAREGIEGIRNIRDTNWLLYSDRRRDCWNHNPDTSPCNGSTPILPGTYIIYQHDTNTWRLALADNTPGMDSDGDGNDTNDLDLSPLSLSDIDLGLDSNADGNLANDLDIYNHTTDLSNPLGSYVQSTPFRRYLVIEYLENQPDPGSEPSNFDLPHDSINSLDEWTDGANNPTTLNRMRVTSVVDWTNRNATHSAQLSTILTDHLGRENLEG